MRLRVVFSQIRFQFLRIQSIRDSAEVQPDETVAREKAALAEDLNTPVPRNVSALLASAGLLAGLRLLDRHLGGSRFFNSCIHVISFRGKRRGDDINHSDGQQKANAARGPGPPAPCALPA